MNPLGFDLRRLRSVPRGPKAWASRLSQDPRLVLLLGGRPSPLGILTQSGVRKAHTNLRGNPEGIWQESN